MKPLLLLDIDGVLCPYGDGPPEGYIVHDSLYPEIWYSPESGRALNTLRNFYELTWATMWENQANKYLCPLLDLDPLPYINFTSKIDLQTNTYKLPAVMEYVNNRPFVWLDDDIWEDALDWASERNVTIPTKIIRVEPTIGWNEEIVDQLMEFLVSVNDSMTEGCGYGSSLTSNA